MCSENLPGCLTMAVVYACLQPLGAHDLLDTKRGVRLFVSLSELILGVGRLAFCTEKENTS